MATSSMQAEVMVGAVLGETYEVTRLLGEGGMGAVWEAKHRRLPGKRFAIKVLHGHAAADAEAYARFRREAEIASRIGHPNIIEVLDWNTLPSGAPYLVLEFLDGEDLATRLSRGPLPVDQALAIARQIGSALKAAHAAEVVHRDLKPGNIFLVPREQDGVIIDHVKVLDFGISKIRNSQTVQTQDAVLLGTPQYMAPEQAQGKNHEIDGRTDVFALGAICYEMISGKASFFGNTLAEVVFKVVYEPVPPLTQLVPELDPAMAAAIERAMAKAPADRFPDVGAFIGALTGRGLATMDHRAVSGSAVGAVVPPTRGRDSGATGVDPKSHLRGEVQAKAQPRGGRLPFLAVAIVVGAAGTFGVVRLLATGGPPAGPTPPVVTAPPSQPNQPVQAVQPTAPSVEPAPPTQPVDPPVDASVEKKKPTAKASHVDAPSAPEPPALKAILDEAEAALRSGDSTQALVLADRSLRTQKSSRAYSIMTRAHCKAGDLGGAKSTYPHVSSTDRPRVRKECKARDIDLD